MISARPYKTGDERERGDRRARRCAGTQFDAAVIEAFTQVIAQAQPDLRAA